MLQPVCPGLGTGGSGSLQPLPHMSSRAPALLQPWQLIICLHHGVDSILLIIKLWLTLAS